MSRNGICSTCEVNEAIDRERLSEPGMSVELQRFGFGPSDSADDRIAGGFLPWDQSFRELLDHSRIFPVLENVVGSNFRLDRYYGI